MEVVKLSVLYLAFPLVVTLAMEVPVLLIGFGKEAYPAAYKVLVFVLVNLITNLTMNSVGIVFRPELMIVIAEEVLIVLIEAYIYRRAYLTKFRIALLNSFVANAFSGIAGSLLIHRMLQ